MNGRKILLAWMVALTLAIPGGAQAAYLRESRGRPADYAGADERHQLARVRSIMMPLLRVSNQRRSAEDIRITVVNDPAVNAGTAGNGQFLVTTSLLENATDDQLRGVLAHEIAHEDLGHPAKAQVIGAGMSIGVALLERLFPGSSSLTPIAGSLITNRYTRPLELDADRHAVTLLRRAGYSKQTMIAALMWLRDRTADSGGVLSSHPAISERIHALRALR